MNSIGCALTEIVLAWDPTVPAQRVAVPGPFGTWIHDDNRPVLQYRRIYTIKPDGTYVLVLVSRPKGSTHHTVVAREIGQFIRI